MRLKIGAGDARFDQDQGEDGSVRGDGMDDEVEPVGEEGAHHQAHLVDGCVGWRARGDVEEVGRGVEGAGDPEGRAGFGDSGEDAEAESEFLRAGEFVGEGDEVPKRLVGGDEVASGGGAGVVGADAAVDVAGVEWDVGVLRAAGLAGPDGGDVEGERGRGRRALGEGRGAGGEDADGKAESE